MAKKLRWYQVFLGGRVIDEVPYTLTEEDQMEREEYVRRSLVEHDGYDSQISVKEG